MPVSSKIEDHELDDIPITVYICACNRPAERELIAQEVKRILGVQGIHVSNWSLLDIKWLASVKHFPMLREMKDKETKVEVRTASFPSERVTELLNRETAVDDRPAILSRIRWGNNRKTSDISVDKQYLIRWGDTWRTGTFVVRADNGDWQFIEANEGYGGKKYDLNNEGQPRGIQQVYEIVQ